MRLDAAGWPFLAVLGTLVPIVALWQPLAAFVPAALLLFCLNFFRDPERATPQDPHALYSPADGRVVRADAARVSIFMNVFDVHVCRAPTGGRVTAVERAHGRFLAAMKDDASEHNERTSIVLEAPGGMVRFTLVAGLIARRIVCRVRAGQSVGAGERIGIIRFGSRVDVDLSAGSTPAVAVGQRVVAGETPIARRSDRAAAPTPL
jgi:phosphatidylserine decarboxylase